jgi:cytochrome c nitrite reductase small subunit
MPEPAPQTPEAARPKCSRWGLRIALLCVLLGIGLGLGGTTFFYAKGLSYLTTDPRSCANCHIMQEQYDGWQKSSHHAVAVCADCHMPHTFFAKYFTKAESGYLHSKAFTLQNFHEPIFLREKSSRILNQACLHCHADLVSDLAENRAGQADFHSKPERCTHCHNQVGH